MSSFCVCVCVFGAGRVQFCTVIYYFHIHKTFKTAAVQSSFYYLVHFSLPGVDLTLELLLYGGQILVVYSNIASQQGKFSSIVIMSHSHPV